MKIRNVKIKKTKKNDIKKSGYYAVLGNEELADLLRKGQSTTIRNGNELEDIIANQVSFNKVCSINFEDLLNKINTNPTENFYISKFSLKKEVLVDNGIELKGKKSISIDGLLYKDSVLYIIEYKDGDNLDTKKSQGEIESLSKISKLFTLFGIESYYCYNLMIISRTKHFGLIPKCLNFTIYKCIFTFFLNFLLKLIRIIFHTPFSREHSMFI
jgi:hypothetical protein